MYFATRCQESFWKVSPKHFARTRERSRKERGTRALESLLKCTQATSCGVRKSCSGEHLLFLRYVTVNASNTKKQGTLIEDYVLDTTSEA